MILINFFEVNRIDVLLPIKSLLPDQIFFFTDSSTHSTAPKCLKETIRLFYKTKKQPTVRFIHVKRNDTQTLETELRSILKKHEKQEIYLNLTGGYEKMVIIGYSLAVSFDHVTPIFNNYQTNQIQDVLQETPIAKLNHITLDEYMTAIGAKQQTTFHLSPVPKEYGHIKKMAEYLFDNEASWHALCEYLQQNTSSKTLHTKFNIPNSYTYNGNRTQIHSLMKKFASYGFVEEHDKNTFSYVSERYKQYLLTYGIWLEMYVYIYAKEYFDDAGISVCIDWSAFDEEDTIDNEIDVLAIKNSIPYFISCKMAEPEISHLYEIGYVATHVPGIKAYPILISTHTIYGGQTQKKKLLTSRFKKLHIGFIEAEAFKNTKPSTLFTESIQK